MAENGQPVTKQDLLAALGEFERRLDQKLDALDTRFERRVRDMETSLLTEFHAYAERVDLRLRAVETFSSLSSQRLSNLEASSKLIAIERRLVEIEKRLNIPPLPPP